MKQSESEPKIVRISPGDGIIHLGVDIIDSAHRESVDQFLIHAAEDLEDAIIKMKAVDPSNLMLSVLDASISAENTLRFLICIAINKAYVLAPRAWLYREASRFYEAIPRGYVRVFDAFHSDVTKEQAIEAIGFATVLLEFAKMQQK